MLIHKVNSSRPICSGIWYWYCLTCHKRYINNKGHAKCYKNFCRVCEINFENNDQYLRHANIIHMDTFCERCKVVYHDGFFANHKCNSFNKKSF